MRRVNVQEAKTNLSKLLSDVERGEQIVLSRSGRAVAQLVPMSPPPPRQLGGDVGRIWISDDFDAPLDTDLLAAFEGADP